MSINISTLFIPISACYYSGLRSAITIFCQAKSFVFYNVRINPSVIKNEVKATNIKLW